MKPRLFFFLALIASFLAGCASPSVLIRKGDPQFNESQKRLQHTIKLVDETSATPEEKALFLQAESFYRYRFLPSAQSTGSFLVSAAASITDFPAFQSLAGSMSLLDLRIRASDSAIQLWETLLKQYPETPLHNLALYRLGWAYRNAAASGLPRRNPNQAFDELIHDQPGAKLAALAREAEHVSWKSKTTAETLSVIPGLGQFYVGETRNGVIRLSIATAAAVAVIVPIIAASRRRSELNWNHDWQLLASGLGGLIVLSFDYTSSYQDAMRGVVQWNERSEAKFNTDHPQAP